MDSKRWALISELFHKLEEIAPAQREGALEELCAGDASLADELRAMLAAAPEAEAQLAALIEAEPQEFEDFEQAIPERLGPFALKRELGRGGMGSVWLAERVEGGFEQRLACKFIRRGMDTGQILRLFAQERRILALLQHASIARLVDGGATEDGRPYFLMEYVEGQPLLSWAENQPLAARLKAFLAICGAIQYAHANLIVHRDLKPANILMDLQNQVKVLDFGIAKILEASSSGDGTRTKIRGFTPGFSSPEQEAGKPATIADDIYSLGAVLEALLGTARPNADLQAIVSKAMREEPALRYASVEQLSKDVSNALENRPVQARQGNLRYLAQKFLLRHWASVAASAAFVMLLSGSLLWSLYQSRQIARERDRAEIVAQFLSGLFATADPEQNQGKRLSLDQLLDDGLNRARAIADPATRHTLMNTIATAFFGLGQYEKTVSLQRELANRYLEEGDRTTARLATSFGFLAEAESARDRHADAEEWGKRAVAMARAIRPQDLGTLALALQHQCIQLHQGSKFEAAGQACREADVVAGKAKASPSLRASILSNLGRTLQSSEKLAEAERVYQQASSFASQSGVEMNSTSASVLSGLSSLYYHQEKFQEAEATLRQAIEFKRKLYPNGHLELARSLNNLGNIVSSQQRETEAVPIFEEAQQYYRAALGPRSSELAASLSNLAIAKSFLKENEEAAKLLEQVVEMHAATVGAGSLPHLNSQLKLASIVAEDLGQPGRAKVILESLVSGFSRLEAAPVMQTNYAKSILAYCLMEARNPAAAERLSREARGALSKTLPAGHPLLAHVDTVLAGSLIRLDRLEEAELLLSPLVKKEQKQSSGGWRGAQSLRYWNELQARRK